MGESVVEIRGDEKALCFGTIVSKDGLVVTKASELKGKTTVSIDGDKAIPATLVGKDEATDIALLRLDTTVAGLSDPVWAPADTTLGEVLVVPNPQEAFLSMAVTGVEERPIAKTTRSPGNGAKVRLGVLSRKDYIGPGSLVSGLPKEGAATKGGIEIGDLIVAIDGDVVTSHGHMVRKLLEYEPKDKIKIRVLRNGKLVTCKVTLAEAKNTPRLVQPKDTVNGDNLSKRYAPFSMAFQHDAWIEANECGGPVLDLEGRIVGVNIARLNRIAAFAIPADNLQETIAALLAKESEKKTEEKK